ncbi:hypothetical protein [Streptomyces sp. NBC_01198]|uniref:hypothetical protein n=1 Tax=Streptomyces sp. NBC_01198 TaxID=2903769 RepID=UPI002E127D1D|nr:hypothetical protein OG702_30900 [Streptomyces sp. NBC_01198]
MSDMMKPEDVAGVPSGHPRISGPANVWFYADFFDARSRADADAVQEARTHHEGLSARVLESGRGVHDLLERLRYWGAPSRGELRPLADAFARHVKGTEATARRALEKRHVATDAIREDRAEGERLQKDLAYLMSADLPEGTYPLTASGVLAGIDQYVGHEQRDLVPAIERELSPLESARLARAFPG